MFNAIRKLFKRASLHRLPDRVFFQESDKDAAILSQLQQTPSDRMLCVGFFLNSVQSIETVLKKGGLAYRLLEDSGDLHDYLDSSSRQVYLALASNLCHLLQDRWSAAPPTGRQADSPRSVIALQHFPRRQEEQQLEDALGSLGLPMELRYYTSLTDPLLQHYGGPRLARFLQQLSTGAFPLEHRLIDNAIFRAQKDIARHSSNHPCRSVEEWFLTNLP
jgi:hypothetical protein